MPSAPLPAGSCATSATGSSCRPATPARSQARSGVCTTIPACARASAPTAARTSAPTQPRHGPRGSAARWSRRAGAGRLDTVTARAEGGWPVRPAPSFPPSRHRFMRRALLLTALLCLLAPASSLASTASDGNRVIRDCSSDGEINGKYSQGAYNYARKHLPSDLAEYTNCADAIRQAQATAAAGHSSGGGGGGGGGTGGGSTGGGSTGGFDVPATPYTAPSVSPS